MKNVANCPKCGKIFVKALRPICQHCYKEQEDQFDKVSTFMRKKQNRMSSIREVHEQTEVELTLIHQFVREGRLQTKSFPNLGYPCESCGEIIKEGRICGGCTANITTGLDNLQKEKEFQERKDAERRAEKSKGATYHSLKDRF
ncbi:TIGR03826 family flagellar region protein [Alkalihalobacillus deserti]|uniref:TIGR03826 family flagellar region protein n=1 Tax=Alkalihalobacillus deserti TaxID=2879466 RepID=UPI001D159AE3|nr:TIGR03826 family flagellar region protein [Alkalihalobacillus deserti]